MTEKLFEEDRYIIKNSRIWDTYKKLPITPKLTTSECDVIIAHLKYHKEIIARNSGTIKYCFDEYHKLKQENEQLQKSLLASVEKNRKLQTILDKLGYTYMGDLK